MNKQNENSTPRVTTMIFAAGLGTRLYPLTASRPKAMVRYQGKPLIEWALEKMAAAGVRDVIVNVHHFADQIIDFVKGYPFDGRIRISDERAYLRDTAGGLKFAEPLCGDSDLLLLYNVDILSTIDLRKMLAHHIDTGADVTLAVRQRQTARYLVFNQDDMRLCGWKNIKTGEEIMPVEPARPVDLAFSGIHVLNRSFVDHIPSVEKHSLTPLYLQNADHFRVLGYQHQEDDWMDVGKYEEFCNVLI